MSSAICQKCRKPHQERGHYCQDCATLRAEKTVKERAKKKRDAFYGTARWKKTSLRHRKIEPLCVPCKASGIIKPVDMVDHIIEVKDGGALYDHSNLMSICWPCHGKKTGKKARERNKNTCI